MLPFPPLFSYARDFFSSNRCCQQYEFVLIICFDFSESGCISRRWWHEWNETQFCFHGYGRNPPCCHRPFPAGRHCKSGSLCRPTSRNVSQFKFPAKIEMAFAYLNLTEFFFVVLTHGKFYIPVSKSAYYFKLLILVAYCCCRSHLIFFFPISLSLCILSSIHKINILYFDIIIQHVPWWLCEIRENVWFIFVECTSCFQKILNENYTKCHKQIWTLKLSKSGLQQSK